MTSNPTNTSEVFATPIGGDGLAPAAAMPPVDLSGIWKNMRPLDISSLALATPTDASLPQVAIDAAARTDALPATDALPDPDDVLAQETFKPQEYDHKWDKLLNDPSIERSQSDKTDGQGHELWERKADDITNISVRYGHKEGDPPANYKIDKDGKVHELIPPDKKAMGDGDSTVVLELDDSAGEAVRSANSSMMASANDMISRIKEQAAYAGVAPDIPSELLKMREGESVPPPRAVSRSGGIAGSSGGGMSVPGHSNGGFTGGAGGAPRQSAPLARGATRSDAAGSVPSANTGFDRSVLSTPEMSAKISSIVSNPAMVPKITDIMDKVVSKNEGKLSSINWNDNGAGVSVGMFQWNQRRGELPDLMQRMNQEKPEAFRAAFGPYADKMLDEGYVRNANISPRSELGAAMQRAMNDPELQKVQYVMAVEKVAKCAEVAREHGVTSVAGVALFADLTNQLGMGGRNKGAMHYLLAAQHAGNTEGSRVNALFNYSSSHPNRGRRNGAVAQEIQKGGLSFSEGSMWAGANTAQPQYADPQPQRNQGNG